MPTAWEPTEAFWSSDSGKDSRLNCDLYLWELAEIHGGVEPRAWGFRRQRAKARFPNLPWRSLKTGQAAKPERLPPTHGKEHGVALTDEEMLAQLESRGYSLIKDPDVTPSIHTVDVSRFSGDVLKFGVVSDSHLCSKYQQLTYLNAAYDLFEREGVTEVLHGGDVTAGDGNVYKGQRYELFLSGADEVYEYTAERYPRRDGITTHLISGNHDLSFLKSGGADIIARIAGERPDLNYLGQYSAILRFGKLSIGLHHGGGGNAYARTYKLQKLIEQVAPENKPHIFLLGHYHCTAGLESYRNVFGRQLPCFEAQTPYLTRLGLYPEIGFYVITATLNPTDREDGVTRFTADYYPFYVPLEKDW